MEKTIAQVIQSARESPPESPQSRLEAKINGKAVSYTTKQLDCFWKNEFANSLKSVSPQFTIDNGNKLLVSSLYEYAWRHDGRLDPRKGLLLHGDLGVGKSTLLKGLQNFMGKINRYCYGLDNPYITFQLTSAAEIALLYAEKGIDGISRFTDREKMGNLAIDEVGREPLDSKHYGTSINVIQTILQLRYEERHRYFTHMTTNLDPNDGFSGAYGYYIADRVKEMFNVVKIEGRSRR